MIIGRGRAEKVQSYFLGGGSTELATPPLEHDPEKACPGHGRLKDGVALLAYDPGWGPVFATKSRSNKKPKQDDASKKVIPR